MVVLPMRAKGGRNRNAIGSQSRLTGQSRSHVCAHMSLLFRLEFLLIFYWSTREIPVYRTRTQPFAVLVLVLDPQWLGLFLGLRQ
jgi:hypothetical protein